MMAEPAAPAEQNTSVEHAFAILRLLATADAAIGVADIARELGLSLTTTHRVLTTLCEADYVSQQREGGKYETGIRVREVLMTLYHRYPLRSAATSTMRELARLSEQAATLTVRFGDRALRIAGVRDHQYVHRPLLIGEMTPLHVGPASRVILAGQPTAAVKAYVAARTRELGARHSRMLRAELDQIRLDGHLLDQSDGLTTVAFPLTNADGMAVAAVALEGATVQFRAPSGPRLRRWARVVAELQQECLAAPDTLVGPFDRIPESAMNPPTQP